MPLPDFPEKNQTLGVLYFDSHCIIVIVVLLHYCKHKCSHELFFGTGHFQGALAEQFAGITKWLIQGIPATLQNRAATSFPRSTCRTISGITKWLIQGIPATLQNRAATSFPRSTCRTIAGITKWLIQGIPATL